MISKRVALGLLMILPTTAPMSLPVAAVAADFTATPAPRDPWVPPGLRKISPVPPSQGASLDDEVRRKLRASFDAADVGHLGALTREQARRGGFGFVANNFDRIDVDRKGSVTFEDLLRYLRANGARI
jgi:hypothetical protein